MMTGHKTDLFSVDCPCCLVRVGEPCVTAWICSARKAVLEESKDALLTGAAESIVLEVKTFPRTLETHVLFKHKGRGCGTLIFEAGLFPWRMFALALWRSSEGLDGFDDEDFDGWFSTMMKNGHAVLYYGVK